jgi:hypothetical protein
LTGGAVNQLRERLEKAEALYFGATLRGAAVNEFPWNGRSVFLRNRRKPGARLTDIALVRVVLGLTAKSYCENPPGRDTW